jgi:spermidine dehydrogenase
MDRPIPRRDFLNGLAISLGAAALPRGAFDYLADDPFAPERGRDDYPPPRKGLRGSHPGSYEVAHRVRDGGVAPFLARARPTGETYDLVVVGGGISGLSAAYFYQQAAGGHARVLVLDNHDDFGGHAKRNEFRVGDKLLIGYGGTQSIDGPARYSAVASKLLADVGVETKRFYQAFDREFYQRHGLRGGVFFDRETFGADRLIPGLSRRELPELESSNAFKDAPLSEPALRAIARLYADKTTDYLPGLSDAAKKAKLAKTSYRDYLATVIKLPADALPYFQTMSHDLYGVGIDAVSALDCWGLDYPGFEGLKLQRTDAPGISLTAAPHEEEPYIFHFPDGNASVARLLVRRLVPSVGPGQTMDDIVTARFDYGRLDRSGAPTRIRLNSTAIRVRHLAPPAGGDVEVTYVRGDAVRTVRARACVLACWNSVIPHLCPELPAAQKEALAYGVKVPLVYTNVALRNWTAFKRLGINSVFAPGSYFTSLSLDFPVSLGRYQFSRGPEEPIVLHTLRTPCKPGLPARQQHRAGHLELLTTSFETFERELRSELARILGAGGFDPARDIAGITVNRWPHGYAYEYNSLWDPLWPAGEQPCVVGRQRFGRIAIANSDAEAYAYTNAAIDQAHRAVSELLALK